MFYYFVTNTLFVLCERERTGLPVALCALLCQLRVMVTWLSGLVLSGVPTRVERELLCPSLCHATLRENKTKKTTLPCLHACFPPDLQDERVTCSSCFLSPILVCILVFLRPSTPPHDIWRCTARLRKTSIKHGGGRGSRLGRDSQDCARFASENLHPDFSVRPTFTSGLSLSRKVRVKTAR